MTNQEVLRYRLSRRALAAGCLAMAMLAQGCAVRSISDPQRPWGNGNTTYAGELNDLDVVGRFAGDVRPEAAEWKLRRGQRVLVVQSGAMFPDEPMLTGLGAHLQVAALSGVPSASSASDHGMRAAAARGGFDAVLCYWGVLESRERANSGKVASWVPIVGFFVPDQDQEMRIRLRIVVLDVATGRWRSLMPAPIDDTRASSLVTRERSDARQVEFLKEGAYRAAVDLVVREVLQQ